MFNSDRGSTTYGLGGDDVTSPRAPVKPRGTARTSLVSRLCAVSAVPRPKDSTGFVMWREFLASREYGHAYGHEPYVTRAKLDTFTLLRHTVRVFGPLGRLGPDRLDLRPSGR